MVDRRKSRVIIFGAIATAVLGLVGLLIAIEAALLFLPLPATSPQRAWRLRALTSVTTGLIAGAVGGGYFGAASRVDGTQTIAQSMFAFLEGGIVVGVPGLVLGALVGSLLAWDYRRNDPRNAGAEADVLGP